jgi:hypothetical protein
MDVYEACIVSIEQKTYPMVLYDTAGQEAYDRLRPITYPSVWLFGIGLEIVDLYTQTMNLKA